MARNGPLIAIGRKPVAIDLAGRERGVGDAATAVFHNSQQVYRPRLIDPAGEDTLFVCFDAERCFGRDGLLAGIEDPRVPFSVGFAPVAADALLALQHLESEVTRAVPLDTLLVEQTLLWIAGALLRPVSDQRFVRRRRHRDATARAHANTVAAMQEAIALGFREQVLLADIARAGHVSAYHGARMFREVTGRTVHAYVTALRVREALFRLRDSTDALSNIALAVGFCSQSHMTSAFRRHFGVTPARVRRDRNLLAQSRERIGTILTDASSAAR